MIPISQEESFLIRKQFKNVYVTGVNKEHRHRSKGYYMTATESALRALLDTNIVARRELIEVLEDKILKLIENNNFKNNKKVEQIRSEINSIKEMGM